MVGLLDDLPIATPPGASTAPPAASGLTVGVGLIVAATDCDDVPLAGLGAVPGVAVGAVAVLVGVAVAP